MKKLPKLIRMGKKAYESAHVLTNWTGSVPDWFEFGDRQAEDIWHNAFTLLPTKPSFGSFEFIEFDLDEDGVLWAVFTEGEDGDPNNEHRVECSA